jgi:hypothetical protein
VRVLLSLTGASAPFFFSFLGSTTFVFELNIFMASKSFKDFDVWKNFKRKDKTNWLKFIEGVYSVDSELNSIDDFAVRVNTAIIHAGLDPKTKEVQSVINREDQEIEELIFHYLSYYQNSNAFQQLINDQVQFWNIQRILAKPVQLEDDQDEDKLVAKYKKRGELSELSDAIRKRINVLKAEIFKSEKTQEIAGAFIRQVLRPEERIKRPENV